MSDRVDVRDQLVDDLTARLVDPLVALLGADLHPILTGRLADRADMLAAELRADESAARAAAAAVSALWGREGPDAAWWRTPLGRACARALADQSTEAITYQKAADMLGVERGTAARMVPRGTLERHPGGGVALASVLRRLGRQGA